MLPVISTGAHAGSTLSSRFALLFSLLFPRISLTCISDSTLPPSLSRQEPRGSAAPSQRSSDQERAHQPVTLTLHFPASCFVPSANLLRY